MSDSINLSEVLKKVASGPASVSTDGTTITMPNIKDVIEAQKFLAQMAAAKTPWRAIKFTPISFPGAVR